MVYVAWNSATQNLRVTTHSLQDPSQLAPSGYSYAMDDGHKWTMARPRPQIPYAITSHDFLAHFSTLYNGKEYRRGNFNKKTVGESILGRRPFFMWDKIRVKWYVFVYEPFLGSSTRSENQKNDRFKFLKFQILGWTPNLNYVFSAINIKCDLTTKN